MSAPRPPSFNRIARPYRWLEYLTLGTALQNCRTHFLPELLHSHRALVLGDGDGRFLAQLLLSSPRLQATAIDSSSAMLALLRRRCAQASTRLTTIHTDALTHPLAGRYDLIVTHFFLDCLTQAELESLTLRVVPHLQPGALWLLSDFRIPPTGALRLPSHLFVRLLYLAFRLLTGLRTTQLPNHTEALTHAGLTRLAHHQSLQGLLISELWQAPVA